MTDTTLAPIVDITPLDRSDWLDWRRHGIGGSDIAAILGISKWGSPWSVWADKMGLTADSVENDEMTGGRWLELAIGPWFTDRTGLYLTHQQARIIHPDRPWQRCTLDGAVSDGPNLENIADALGVAEIKTGERGADWDEIPAYYQAQGQWQMATTGLGHLWLPMLHGRRLTVYELKRDQADIDYMIELAERFWTDHVMTGEPPAADGSDATLTAMGQVWPTHVPDIGVPIDHIASVLDDLAIAKADKAAAEEREKAAKAAIYEVLQDAEAGLIGGRVVVTLKAQDTIRVDAKRLRAEAPDVFAKFSNTTTSRVLRPKKAA